MLQINNSLQKISVAYLKAKRYKTKNFNELQHLLLRCNEEVTVRIKTNKTSVFNFIYIVEVKSKIKLLWIKNTLHCDFCYS